MDRGQTDPFLHDHLQTLEFLEKARRKMISRRYRTETRRQLDKVIEEQAKTFDHEYSKQKGLQIGSAIMRRLLALSTALVTTYPGCTALGPKLGGLDSVMAAIIQVFRTGLREIPNAVFEGFKEMKEQMPSEFPKSIKELALLTERIYEI